MENLRQSAALLDDPERCVHIGDRESDIYELFCTAEQMGTHFLVRTCVDRLRRRRYQHDRQGDEAGARSRSAPHKGQETRMVELSEAVLEIRYCRLVVLPPIGKQKKLPRN